MHTFIRSLIKVSTYALALTTSAALPGCDDPQPEIDASDSVTPAELDMGLGWEEKSHGLWTRVDANGTQQYIGIGEAGQQHAIISLEAAESELLAVLEAEESEETRAQLEELDALITELRASEVPTTTEPDLRCTPPTVGGTVDAYPSSCGVSAKATASYSHCANTGTIRTYAQATCGYEAVTHSCGPKAGTSTSCTSQVSLIGPAPCRSYTYAQISAPNVYVYIWDENLQRGSCSPPPPLCGGSCAPGKDCHCGDICRPINTLCP